PNSDRAIPAGRREALPIGPKGNARDPASMPTKAIELLTDRWIPDLDFSGDVGKFSSPESNSLAVRGEGLRPNNPGVREGTDFLARRAIPNDDFARRIIASPISCCRGNFISIRA